MTERFDPLHDPDADLQPPEEFEPPIPPLPASTLDDDVPDLTGLDQEFTSSSDIGAEILAPRQSLENQIERWLTDFRAFAEDLLMVQTPEGDLIPFKLNNVQVALEEIIADIRANGRFVRLIVDKLRRAGCSSYFGGRGYWKSSTQHNHYGLLIAHEPEATDTIFGMTKRFHAHTPKKMRPQVLYDNRKALVFNTKTRVGGLDSELKCGTAGKEHLGSSQSVNYLHLSEFSKWPAHTIDDLMTSLTPTIPKTQDSEFFIESTANGIGNKYHTMWLQARYHYEMYLDEHGALAWRASINEDAKPDNTWSRVFIPWFVFEKCALPTAQWERQTGQKFVLTQEEKNFVKTYLSGCSPTIQKQKMAWYRQVLEDDFHGDRDRRAQEYPATWQESFISSGDAAFDTIKVNALFEWATKVERDHPCKKFEVDLRSGVCVPEARGRLWVWEDPIPGEAYVVICDPSKGIVINDRVGGAERHDFTEISIKHHLTRREVAHWSGKIDPDLCGTLLFHLGKRYNESWIIPENNNHGNTVISVLLRLKYRKIYVEKKLEPPNPPRKVYGFSTQGGRDGGVRAEAINALVQAVRENRHGIRYPRTFAQMLTFKRSAKGRYEAESRQKDDCVTVECIAQFGIPMLPLPAGAPRPDVRPVAQSSEIVARLADGWG